ncbi:hypothetical protein ABRP72_09625 [Pectobacterium carotovorum]|uniref:hypothetical protein n=1 Tax=Pectobacterium TaxID=122277 RepID=UPI00094A3DDA|nr:MULTISPECIES: hypothetical protein [Pectobacterium]APS29580.1 hypothetical protein NC16_07575 [Pectobacterium brasiliense]MBN3064373.1 hypothetical protein [Pectobacterium aquaticum]MBN3103770.1 hypothetical protein [Pectobacterium brasiliense]QSD24203.1 hypothetical protein H5A38_07830 [Pectobacterium brasiliense]WGL26561.1 hypothetical protein OWC53_14395 [Pectobacterium brasiliense]
MTPEYRIDAERRITEYLKSQNLENIKNMQVEQTFNDLGFEVNIWNVRTKNDGNWWVAEGENVPLNLYTQNEYFFSADEAYSFHLGITQRLQVRHHTDFKHVIDELPLDIDMLRSISRRLNASAVSLNSINAPEDIQSIGLVCRESMVELAAHLYKSHEDILKKEDIKAADFKNICKVIIGLYAAGKRNSSLRKYCRSTIESAWDISAETVHSSNKNFPDAKICLLLTCTAVSLIQNLFLKFIGFDSEIKCPNCHGLNTEIYESEEDSQLHIVCCECGQVVQTLSEETDD